MLIERMAHPGREMMVGMIGDPDLGPFMVVAAGGAEAEADPDAEILAVPVSVAAAERAIMRLRCAPLLEGWRGGPPADVRALAQLVAHLSDWSLDGDEQLIELDLNPVLVHAAGRGLDIVDALAVVRAVE